MLINVYSLLSYKGEAPLSHQYEETIEKIPPKLPLLRGGNIPLFGKEARA